MQAQLDRFYAAQGQTVRVSNIASISDGWETEVYSFAAERDGHAEQLILRMYPGANAAATCQHEYAALHDLHAAGYPVPQVFEHSANPDWLGKPFLIMQKIEGRPLAALMREDEARQPERLALFCRLFAELHALDAKRFSLRRYADSEREMLPSLLSRYRIFAESVKQAWALPVIGWLEANAAAPGETASWSPLHGDFHPNNILVAADGRPYVIDWSGFNIGDFRTDLAWTLLLVGTNGHPELREPIIAEYERASGRAAAHIGYFEVMAALRRLLDFAVSLTSGAEAMGMRPETVAIMRGQKRRYAAVYAVVTDNSGLRLPEIERLLESL